MTEDRWPSRQAGGEARLAGREPPDHATNQPPGIKTACRRYGRSFQPSSAHIILLIPFGQYYAKELKQAVATHQQTHPSDKKLSLIDLGPTAARSLAPKNGLLGGLHPNDRGHALFAAKIIPQVLGILGGGK